jgi:hypothetical protein
MKMETIFEDYTLVSQFTTLTRMLWVVFNRKRQGVPFPAFTINTKNDYASLVCSAAVAFLAIV